MTTRAMVIAALLGFLVVAGAILMFAEGGGAISHLH